jgi:cobalt-zinc-cadmium resistance protein CzcA
VVEEVVQAGVITSASVRLRAELLSALIGSISLIPFIISSGTGAEIEKPLAIVVVGGGNTPHQDSDLANGL